MENDDLKIIKDSLVVIKHAADTASGTLARAEECLKEFNRSTRKQAHITMGLTLIIAVASCFSAWAACSMTTLTRVINVPNVGLVYKQGSIILKNFGNLTAKGTRVLWEGIEFAETPKSLVSGVTEIDLIFSKDYIAVPTQNIPVSQHAQFLIYVWDGGHSGILSRVFLRKGNDWIITVKSLVDSQQWKVLEERIQTMKSRLQNQDLSRK